MKINADLRERALVKSAEIDWVSSPSTGVERKMLERDGDEVARATSIVRYAIHDRIGTSEFLLLYPQDATFVRQCRPFTEFCPLLP